MDNTIWKDIEGYEGLYKISNKGEVYSYRRKKMLKLSKDKDGYIQITLCKDSIEKKGKVHRLVCFAFLETIENKNQVNHKNGIKDDNRVENLEWCNSSENNKHAYATGLKKTTEKQRKNASLNGKKGSKKIIGFISSESIIFDSIREAGRFLNISHIAISRCCNGKYNTSGIYKGEKVKWKFAKDVVVC